MGILDRVKTSSDLKSLTVDQLKTLSEEVRARIVEVTRTNGGHLASNLGIVETTIALHYVFDFPTDKLLFDVGHQCYAHKMLSGRNDRFSTLRTEGGLSGFPSREESEYDTFTVGHSGTSLSSGLGLCAARDKQDQDYYVVNVVGDGSFVNGLNLEAFFAKEYKPKKFVVILNDNGMSISKNKNGLYNFLSKQSISESYRKSKGAIKKIFRNSFITRWLKKLRSGIKRLFNRNNYIENFGFKYVGVVDGNDINELIHTLNDIKKVSDGKAVLLHLKTIKGKGLEKAEEHSDIYHGVGKDHTSGTGAFSKTLGETLNNLIQKDQRIVAITAGMKDGTGLTAVENNYPNNFYDMGIAEEYAVTFASGLSAGGLKPVVAMYSTFLQRAYDEILHDICLQNLPVVFCVDRAGLVGQDGATHQGVYDISYLSHLPNIKIFAPTNTTELSYMLEYALSLNSPVVIRYPNEKNTVTRPLVPFDSGLWEVVKDGVDLTILAVGPRALNLALEFAKDCEKSVKVVSARTVKPLDTEILDSIKTKPIITIEENSLSGGFASAVLGYYSKNQDSVKVVSLGVTDNFVEHGTVASQMKALGLTKENLTEICKNI